ncbi:MAG: HEAT repeat domain-containing protein, partial [Candidatus Poseidoniales archaeon]|nr:HEAT repeat domain-containing protein [Candidatus Poseidoniales archaeon]
MDADSEMLRILGNMGSQDPQSRLEAVRYLGENGDDRAIQPLCEALLRDKSLDVRESAAYSLSEIDSLGDSADALLKAIENHRDADWFGSHPSEYCILTEVVMALGKVCISHENDAPFHSEVIEKLTEIMLDSSLTLPTGWPREGFENGRCNADAAIALGWVGDKSSIGGLIEAFNRHYGSYEFDKEGYDEEIAIYDAYEDDLSRDDFINHTSWWAMWSIGQIGHTDALPQLRKLLEDLRIKWDNDNFEWWELGLWHCVVEAIGKCGNNSVYHFNPSDRLWDFLQHLIKTDSKNWTSSLRCSLLSALIEIHDSNLTNRLIEVLKEEDITPLHQLAAKALGEIGDTIAVKPLCDFISHNADVAIDITWADGNYHFYLEAIRMAIRALGEIGDESSIDILVKSLWWVEDQPFSLDYYMPTAEDSVFALASIGTGRAIDELIRFLNDSQLIQKNLCSSNVHNLIRFIIVEKLEEMDVDRSIDVLISRLDDTDVKVRAAAACALGHFRAEGAVEPLTKLLNRGPLHETELSRDDWDA